jgi:cbb3-type cytochrome oxidase subunit 3
MTTQIFALILVVASFAALFTWAFWPGNKSRFEAQGRLVLDAEHSQQATVEGEKS